MDEQVIQQVEMLQQQLNSVLMQEQELWSAFENSRDKAMYDCTIDEIQSTPTYKLATLETLTKLLHQGGTSLG